MLNQIINNYKIIEELDTGGMGTVYLAQHISIEKKVAIKRLHPHLTKDESIKERFLREAEMQSKLKHPGITNIIDYLDNENGLFIILEYLEGRPLSKFIFEEKGLIPEGEANQIMIKILDAVGYAHKNSIVHRDLKPSNIMILPSQDVKIMDFGIAKIVGNDSNLTQAGTKLGSPLYMSPEQVLGVNIDQRSDIYSLGVVYYEMLTGNPVYNQQNTTQYQIYDKIVKEALPRVKEIYPHTSEIAQQIIDKATNKNIDLRFHNCEEFKISLSHGKVFEKVITKKSQKKLIMLITLGVFILFFGGFGINYFKNYLKFNELIEVGKEKEANKQYAEAINFYEQAKKYKSDVFIPNSKIRDLEKKSETFVLGHLKRNHLNLFGLEQENNFLNTPFKSLVLNPYLKSNWVEQYKEFQFNIESLKDNSQVLDISQVAKQEKIAKCHNDYFLANIFYAKSKYEMAMQYYKKAEEALDEKSKDEFFIELKRKIINQLSEKANKLLLEAVSKNDYSLAVQAIKNYADPSSLKYKNAPAITKVAFDGDLRMVKLFIDNGAVCDDKSGVLNEPTLLLGSPIVAAASQGHELIVKYFIDSCRVSPNSYEITEDGKNGWTPLLAACGSGNFSIVKYLVDEVNVNLNLKSGDSETAFMRAASGGNIDVLLFLIDKGVNVYETDFRGLDALDYAKTKEVKNFLKKRGLGNLRFKVDFSKNYFLSNNKNLRGSTTINTSSKKITIIHKKGKPYLRFFNVNLNSEKDFSFETKIKLVDYKLFGTSVYRIDIGNLTLGIFKTGKIALFESVNGKWKQLEANPDSRIRSKDNNLIKVSKVGKKIIVEVNKKEVISTVFYKKIGDKFGFGVEDGAKIEISHLNIIGEKK